jgi:hypothetical protein
MISLVVCSTLLDVLTITAIIGMILSVYTVYIYSIQGDIGVFSIVFIVVYTFINSLFSSEYNPELLLKGCIWCCCYLL